MSSSVQSSLNPMKVGHRCVPPTRCPIRVEITARFETDYPSGETVQLATIAAIVTEQAIESRFIDALVVRIG